MDVMGGCSMLSTKAPVGASLSYLHSSPLLFLTGLAPASLVTHSTFFSINPLSSSISFNVKLNFTMVYAANNNDAIRVSADSLNIFNFMSTL